MLCHSSPDVLRSRMLVSQNREIFNAFHVIFTRPYAATGISQTDRSVDPDAPLKSVVLMENVTPVFSTH